MDMTDVVPIVVVINNDFHKHMVQLIFDNDKTGISAERLLPQESRKSVNKQNNTEINNGSTQELVINQQGGKGAQNIKKI